MIRHIVRLQQRTTLRYFNCGSSGLIFPPGLLLPETQVMVDHRRRHSMVVRTMSSEQQPEPDWVRTAIQKMVLEQRHANYNNNNNSETLPDTRNSEQTDGVKTTITSSLYDSRDLEKALQSLQVRYQIRKNGFCCCLLNHDVPSAHSFVSFVSNSGHFHFLVVPTRQNQLQEAELCVQDCRDCVNNAAELQNEIAAADQSIDQAVARFVDLLDEKPAASYVRTEDMVKRIKQLRSDIAKLKLVQQQSMSSTTTATATESTNVIDPK
jgi:hypothetical protein